MRNTATTIILSVVATVLVISIGACITIKPFTAIGLAPILAATSLIIRAIRGQPTHPTKQPNEEVVRQDPDLRDPINATPDGIPVPRDLIDIPRPIPNLPIARTDQQQAPGPQPGSRRRWPRPRRHRHRKSR